MITKRSAKAAAKVEGSPNVDNKFLPLSEGIAQVDERAGIDDAQVYKDKDGNQYSAYLMKADMGKNNNKFYVLQLIEKGGSYYIFTRYGRVGDHGVTDRKLMSLDSAQKEYNKIFRSKTGGAKGYTALRMKAKEEEEKDEEENAEVEKSKLEAQVKNLINYIFDKEAVENSVKAQGFDPRKLPLGEISEDTTQQGYKYLCLIETILNTKEKRGDSFTD